MRAKAVVRLKFSSKKDLLTVFKGLKPEVESPATKRSKASIEKSKNFLILTVEARDTVALRAALNAYLRWINSMMNVLEVVKSRS
jgi:tRNA threonylcarbamoyladenosine modification (KEOPS) complex  Pcc1 subunit